MRLLDASRCFSGTAGNRSILRLFLIFMAVNLLLYGIFTVFVVAPRISASLDNLREVDLRRTVASSAKKFDLFFQDRVGVVSDLATYPYVINAVKLGGQIDPDLVDYLDNVRLFGQQPQVVLLDISQRTLFKSSAFSADLAAFEVGWFEALLAGTDSEAVHLSVGERSEFTYAIAVPVIYEGYTEGVLIAQMEGDLNEFSVLDQDIGFVLRLCDGEECVVQKREVSSEARWIGHPLYLSQLFVELLVDPKGMESEYKQVLSEAMGLLLMTGAVAFFLFAVFGYRTLVKPYQALESQTDELGLLSSVMENAVEGVAYLDVRGRFDFTNEAFEGIFGAHGSELKGNSWRKLVSSSDWSMMEAAFRDLSDKGKTSLEVKGKTRGGQQTYQSITLVASPDDDSTQAGRIFCFAKDISRRKDYEIKLNRANEELSAFAYRTSHDLRAPLMSVKGLLDLAGRSMQKGQLNLAQQCIDKSLNALRRLDHTVDGVLTLSRLDHLQSEETAIDVRSMVDTILQQFVQLDNFDKIKLEQFLEHEEPLISEQERLEQIISNLISNAVKYADMDEPQSRVTIRTKTLDDQFILEVEDNGIGIPPQAQKDVFGMFKRFHTQTAYGSGLGLYLVQKNVEVLGGEVRFEPLEKGTRFVFSIPQHGRQVI